MWFFVVYGRLYLGEHSFAQVFVGVLVGFFYGWIWYKFDDQVGWLISRSNSNYSVGFEKVLSDDRRFASFPLVSVQGRFGFVALGVGL